MKAKKIDVNYDSVISNQTGLSFDEVKANEKQSTMRTTFRLTDKTISAFDLLSKQYKLKSIFDQTSELLIQEKRITDVVAQNAKNMDIAELKNCTKKSFAISNKSVNIFKKLTKEYDVTRDAFVNQSIIAFQMLNDYLKKEEIKKVKRAKKMINQLWSKTEELENKLIELLGSDHQVVVGFGYVPVIIMNLDSAIDEYLETGKAIEVF